MRGHEIYRLRQYPAGRGGKWTNYILTVPRNVGDQLTIKGVTAFEVELTDEGLLYKPVKTAPLKEDEVPDWLK